MNCVVHCEVKLRRCICLWSLVCLASLLLAWPSFAQDNPPPALESPPAQESTPADNPPDRVARISFLHGNVSFLRGGVNQWSQAALNFPVTTGDRIYTDKGARAELQAGAYSVRVSDSSDLTVTNLSNQTIQLGLGQGTIKITVHQLLPGDAVEVDTPNAALTLLAQGTYRVETDPSGGSTVAAVYSGSLQVTGGAVSQTVQSGQAVKLTGQNPVQVESIPLPHPDSFDKWCEERDRRLASSKSLQYVSSGIPGYADLDDYGRWEVAAEYGPVWYPAGVAVDWVPYRFGRWVWVGPWGWTWVEDEPWGFCQFHYGRWVHIGVAWGWLPGPIVIRPVYAPALVAFVGGPSLSVSIGIGGGVAAWFPLGPGEPFFPWYHYRPEYLSEVNITNIRNVTNITNIINVTNINNVHYAYRTVAATAVPANVFSSGQRVASHVVRLAPEQLARAPVVPHPGVNPTLRAALPGRPVAPPPVRAERFVTAARTARTIPVKGSAVPGANRVAPPPRFVTRSAPPPPRVPFALEQRAMIPHPGRPLEPQQLENLRARRPVGPMLDREFPPHMAPPGRRHR